MRVTLRALRRFGSESGAAAVEFALIMPIRFILIFGIIDMGRLLFTANALTSAVREGARFAAVQTVEDHDAVEGHVLRILGAGGMVDTTQILVVPAWDSATATVRIDSYPFNPITPFVNLVNLDEIHLSPSATFRWERVP